MPPLIVPSGALVRLIWNAGSAPYAVNVIGCRKTGATVIDQALANAVGAMIKSGLNASGANGVMGTGISLANVGVRDISTANNVEFLDSGAAVPGGDVGKLLPPQVAQCITLRTARAGKSFRGRMYVPGYTITASDQNGAIVASTRDTTVAFVNAIRTGLPAHGLTMAIVSRANLTTELVTLVQGRDLVWDTIRGRATAGI
jgi:hypothetical protein